MAAVAAPGGRGQGPVEQELEVRALALGREPLRAPGADAPWSLRFLALDGLRRRAPDGLSADELALARASLRDPHPNVREAALVVHAVHGLSPAGALAEGAPEPLASVRRALARALRHLPGEEGDRALLALCRDEDPGVAREARAQLLARGPASREARLELLAGLADAEPFLDALLALELGPDDPALLERLDADLAAAIDAGSEDARARRALLATLRSPPPLELVAEGWTARLARASSRAAREQRERLEGFAIGLGADGPRLARLLSRRLEEERAAARAGEAGADARALSLLRGAALAHHPPSPTRVDPASFEPFPVDPDWGPELAGEFWRLAAGRAPRLGATARLGLEHADADVRGLALEALLDAWRIGGDAEDGALLLELVDDRETGDEVYAALLGARRAPPDPERLHAAWRRRGVARRAALLGAHLAGRPSPAWRDDLIELWGSGAARSAAVVERLGDLRGDAEVERALRGFLDAELAVMESAPVPAEEVTRGPWRDAESRAQALVRAWMRVRGGADLDGEAALLRRVGRLGREVGKTVVAGLATRPEGRARLLGLLEAPELSRRMRFEIVLLVPEGEGTSAFDELYAAHDELDAELRLRSLRRAAGTDREEVRRLLQRVALDRSAAGVLRLAAVDSLARAGDAGETVPRLEAVLAETEDPELRRAAISALGEAASGAAGTALVELVRAGAASEAAGDALLEALARAEARRATAEGSAALAEAWRALPRARRDDELRRRFQGERLPARDFAYRGWLAAAEVMARSGSLEEVLEDEAWTYDARLLERLAQAVRDGGGPGAARLARRLDRAALVALEGEGEAPDLEGARVRVRAKLLEAALAAGEPRRAARLARAQLDALLSGRATALALRNAHGPRDPAAGRDPLARLARLARETGGGASGR